MGASTGSYFALNQEVLLHDRGLQATHLHGTPSRRGTPVLPADARATEALDWITLALGGQAGARLAGRLGLVTSGSTLLRQLRCQVQPDVVTSPRVLGIDAEAIAEAVDRKNMRFVPIKTEDQLDLQAIHRVRDRLVARRTSEINQIRAFLLERGMV